MSEVHAPPNGCTPPYGKSWIRHCDDYQKMEIIERIHNGEADQAVGQPSCGTTKLPAVLIIQGALYRRVYLFFFRLSFFKKSGSAVLYITYMEPTDSGVYTCKDGSEQSQIKIVVDGSFHFHVLL